jgi:hypothetical protein
MFIVFYLSCLDYLYKDDSIPLVHTEFLMFAFPIVSEMAML